MLYEVGSLKSPCQQFQKMEGGLFGFSKGCLHMRRWDELNHFFKYTGATVTFGLNALHGKHQIDSWEFGETTQEKLFVISTLFHLKLILCMLLYR